MNTVVRRLRGLLGTGLTWGVAWVAFGTALGVLIGIVDPASMDPGEEPYIIGAFMGLIGFCSGIAFGLVVIMSEGRRTIEQLSSVRSALWGALASAVFPLAAGKPDQMIWICPLGALLAAGSVAMAKRAVRQESLRDHRLPQLTEPGGPAFSHAPATPETRERDAR
jgi:hypothetical protein